MPSCFLLAACLLIYLSIYLLDQPPWAANGLGPVFAAAAAAGGVLIGEERSRRAVARDNNAGAGGWPDRFIFIHGTT